MLEQSNCEAVAVATPAATHREIVEACLDAGKHVLVEKPLAASGADAAALAAKARECEQILMVGHIFRFNPGVNKLRDLMYDGTAGDVRYMHCVRTNLGPVREDVSVIWDLAAHDVSIALHLLNDVPDRVSAVSQAYLNGTQGDVAFVHLCFPDGRLASIHVSWIDPEKRRHVFVVGSNALLEFNDMSPGEPIRICERGLREEPSYSTFGEFQLVAHARNIVIPAIEMREPLKEQCQHFLDCVQSGQRPLSDVDDGFRVCGILEAAEASASQGGAAVQVADYVNEPAAAS
jgi:predicted dehydrogenase